MLHGVDRKVFLRWEHLCQGPRSDAKIRGRLFRHKCSKFRDPERGVSCRTEANVTGVQGHQEKGI